MIIKLLAVGGIMGLLDFVWLGFVAKKIYYAEMGKLLLDKPNMAAALLFYVIYVVGVIVFVLNPALEKQSWQYAAGMGALFGLVTYATYDLTNLATMKDFPVKIVVIDLIWGAALTAAVATGAHLVMTALGR